jgi:excisionase family DNA binding protein
MTRLAASPATTEELDDCGFVKVKNAARYLDLSRATIYQLMECGKLTYAKFGRSRRIPKEELFAFARRSMVS